VILGAFWGVEGQALNRENEFDYYALLFINNAD